MKINLTSTHKVDSQELKRDLQKIQQSINLQQEIMNLDSRTSDPSVTGSSGKIQVWYRSDLQQIRFNDNGTTYKIQATAA